MVQCSRDAEEASMQLQQEIAKSICNRSAGALRPQPKPTSATAHRIDFKTIKRIARFQRVLAYYGIEISGGRGAQRKALCPFHRDTRPSLNVNLDMKVFNCFACGDGGDIIKFVAKQEYPTDPEGHLVEAAEKLAEICGIRRREASMRTADRGKPQNGELAVPSAPLSFQLKADPTHPYLTERGLSPDIVETFGLGYCMSEQSIMRQRIVIPIHNECGELIAYAGRWPGNSGWPEGRDKYMLPLKFQKMRVLFNLNRVIEGMLEGKWPDHERHVIVVEGFFGVFAIHPLAPCVALMGSVLSDAHMWLLHSANVKFVTLLLDGPSKRETVEKPAVLDQRAAAVAYHLSADGFFVTAPKLGVREQPDMIDRKRLEQFITL
jgi:DNA primase